MRKITKNEIRTGMVMGPYLAILMCVMFVIAIIAAFWEYLGTLALVTLGIVTFYYFWF
jgi:Mg/Co/Ni transporter MgtE